MILPELEGGSDIGAVMDAESVVERYARHEATAPAEPDAEHVHIGIGQLQTGRSCTLPALAPVESDAKDEERVFAPLLPECSSLHEPAFPALPAVVHDPGAAASRGLSSLCKSELAR